MHSRPRRLSRFALGAALLLTFVTIAPAGAAQPPKKFTATDLEPVGRVQGFKSVSSGLAQTDPALVGRKDTGLVNVMIKLDYDAAASYAGGVDGLAATSPQVTGKALDRRAPTVVKYSAYVASQEAAFVKALKAKVPKAVVGQSFRTVYGGVAARIPATCRRGRPRIKGVVAVQYDALRKHRRPTRARTSSARTRCTRSSAGPRQPARASSSATSTRASGPSIRRSPTRATCRRRRRTGRTHGLQLRRQPADPGGRRVRLQQQADRRRAVPRHVPRGSDRAATSLPDTARDSNGHGTHTRARRRQRPRRRRRSSVSSAARSTASPQAPR